MSDLEEQFTRELLGLLQRAEQAGVSDSSLCRAVEKNGGAKALKYRFARNQASLGLEDLARVGKLSLSPEALAVQPKYASLFTDDEVNFCFDLLCQYGFYNGN